MMRSVEQSRSAPFIGKLAHAMVCIAFGVGISAPLTARADDAAMVYDAIGSVTQPVATIMDMQWKMGALQTYTRHFSQVDQLDARGWTIVSRNLQRIVDESISEAEQRMRKNEVAYRATVLAELRQIPHANLAAFATFLKSEDGRRWLEANRTLNTMHRKYVMLMLSQSMLRRRSALYNPVPKEIASVGEVWEHAIDANLWGLEALIRMMQAPLIGGTLYAAATFEPQAAFAAKLADAAGAVRRTYQHQRSSPVSDALLNGIYAAARIAEGQSDLPQIFEKMEVQIAQLALRSRASLQVKDINSCVRVPREIAGSSKADALKHIAARNLNESPLVILGQAYEFGCHVQQNYTTALGFYTEAVNESVRIRCRVADFHRMGLGTARDPQAARMWEEKFAKDAFGAKCVHGVDPRDPWADLPR